MDKYMNEMIDGGTFGGLDSWIVFPTDSNDEIWRQVL